MKFRTFFLLIILSLALVLSACSPDYPKCNNDDDCATSEKGKAEGKLMCVNGLCQQCREDSDCAGNGMTCNSGICERALGFCNSDADCITGQKCRDNRCSSECLSDNECGEGKQCKAGSCVDAVECTMKADCDGNLNCVNGKCVAPAETCALPTLYFPYNSAVLTSEDQSQLQNAASCIKTRGISVRLEGHTDERGTSEYNLALGERRARSAYGYLSKMGVDKSRLSTISYGKENLAKFCGESGPESCHQQNRRVVFQIR